MFINFIRAFLLLSFIVVSLYDIYTRRKIAPGPVVTCDEKVIIDGKQGTSIVIGRGRTNTLSLSDKTLSRKAFAVKAAEPGTGFVIQNLKTGERNIGTYCDAGNNRLDFKLANNSCRQPSGFQALILTIAFIVLQAGAYVGRPVFIGAAALHLSLILFLVASYIANQRTPVLTEEIFAILLSFHTYVNLYNAEKLTARAILGLYLYLFFFCTCKRLFHIDLAVRPGFHRLLRKSAAVGMVIVMVINILLAPRSTTLNWIYIGSISIQPSEIVKILLLCTLICPADTNFYSAENMITMGFCSLSALVYAFIIRDIGLLIILASLIGAAFFVQVPRLLHLFMAFFAALAAGKLILATSSTAANRFYSWLGSNSSVLEAMFGACVLGDPYGSGYQQTKALSSLKASGLFGMNTSLSIIENIGAFDSDLVLALIAEKYGHIAVFLIMALYCLLSVSCIQNLKNQGATNRIFSVVSMTGVCIAFLLNCNGSFGVLPLTGVVSPAISKGLSASFSYGCMFGIFAACNLSKSQLNNIKAQAVPSDSEFINKLKASISKKLSRLKYNRLFAPDEDETLILGENDYE